MARSEQLIHGRTLQRFLRYGGVSVVSAALAQAGLALGYGLLRMTTTEAVVLSLLVSVGPAYWLSRRYVWSGETKAGSLGAFLGLAVVGSALTAGTVAVAASAATALTSDHAVLSAVVNATALGTTVLMWLARFVVFDRFMLVRQPAVGPR